LIQKEGIPTILETWEVEVKGFQYKANLDKNTRLYMKAK
jgi:hypothetical protein